MDERFDDCIWCNGTGDDGGGYRACPDCESTGLKGGRAAVEDFDKEIEKMEKEAKHMKAQNLAYEITKLLSDWKEGKTK